MNIKLTNSSSFLWVDKTGSVYLHEKGIYIHSAVETGLVLIIHQVQLLMRNKHYVEIILMSELGPSNIFSTGLGLEGSTVRVAISWTATKYLWWPIN